MSEKVNEDGTITKFEVHKYLGKELKRESKPEAEKKWKLFKLKFDVGGQYPFTVDCFDGMGTKEDSKSLTLKDLEEGEYYNVGYNVKEKAFEAHGKWHDNRTAFFVSESSAEEWAKRKESSMDSNRAPEATKVKINHDEFFPEWDSMMKSNDRETNAKAYALAVFANYFNEEFNQAMDYFQSKND